MSAIASMYVIDRDTADGVGAAAGPGGGYEILVRSGRRLDRDSFPWSGYCMLDLLLSLAERGISGRDTGTAAMVGAIGEATFVFGPADRSLLPQLDPATFTAEELIESMSASDLDEMEAEAAATDGLNALRSGISALSDDEVLVITIG